jgi:hypothetical protein
MAIRRKRTSERTLSSASIARMTILLEQIQLQNRAIIAAVESEGAATLRAIRAAGHRLEARLFAIELEARLSSLELRQNAAEVCQQAELWRVKEQLAALARVVAVEPDAAALAALDARVTNLERRVGI